MNGWKKVFAAALLATACGGAAAEDDLYGAAMGSLVIPSESDLNTGLGLHFLVGGGWKEDKNWESSLFLHRNQGEGKSPSLDSLGLAFDVNFFDVFGPGHTGQPFLLAGIGVQRDDPGAHIDTRGLVSAGVGVVFPRWNESNVKLRAEARIKGVFGDDSYGDLIFNLGAQFGPYHDQPAPVAAQPITKTTGVYDSDNDGVTDKADKCPGTPAGTKVDGSGCPLKAAPMDNDSDKDGVPNDKDKCPNTSRGAVVDETGCVVLAKVKLTGVSFATGSAELTRDAKSVLDNVADSLAQRKDVEVEIAGHTDSTGSDALNQSLSQRRAESARSYLISKGVAADRLTAKGYGESSPVDTNKTAAGRANNRRVEFKEQ